MTKRFWRVPAVADMLDYSDRYKLHRQRHGISESE
jgi:hypothetical protein